MEAWKISKSCPLMNISNTNGFEAIAKSSALRKSPKIKRVLRSSAQKRNRIPTMKTMESNKGNGSKRKPFSIKMIMPYKSIVSKLRNTILASRPIYLPNCS